MSRVRGKDTGPEVALRRALHRIGLRYRLHDKNLPGSPDLVFARYKAVVFVHGCYWHRHDGCPKATSPKSNVSFWEEKFNRNVERDKHVLANLKNLGWRVFVIWECELVRAKIESTAEKLAADIRSGIIR